ncbi:MAG: hypothetical protein QXV17_07860 [Candidatus Micrarchaeaceae archaeon]
MSYVQVNSTQNGQAFITITCGYAQPPLGTYAYYILTPIPVPINTNEGVVVGSRSVNIGGVSI